MSQSDDNDKDDKLLGLNQKIDRRDFLRCLRHTLIFLGGQAENFFYEWVGARIDFRLRLKPTGWPTLLG